MSERIFVTDCGASWCVAQARQDIMHRTAQWIDLRSLGGPKQHQVTLYTL